ncbi:hypothetical protein ACFLT9_03180, partial [Acidobacteriota bacterium]
MILFSIDRNESFQFYQFMKYALTQEVIHDKWDIWFRTHPALPKEKFMDKVIPHWVEKNEDSLGNILSTVNVVLAGQGGVVLEALAHDCFVIQPLSNVNINMGILTEKDCSNLKSFTHNCNFYSILANSGKSEYNKRDF